MLTSRNCRICRRAFTPTAPNHKLCGRVLCSRIGYAQAQARYYEREVVKLEAQLSDELAREDADDKITCH